MFASYIPLLYDLNQLKIYIAIIMHYWSNNTNILKGCCCMSLLPHLWLPVVLWGLWDMFLTNRASTWKIIYNTVVSVLLRTNSFYYFKYKHKQNNIRQNLSRPHEYNTRLPCDVRDRWNGSCVICHDLISVLLERCNLWLTHNWPPWNQRNKTQTALPSLCLCVFMRPWGFRPVNVSTEGLLHGCVCRE